MNASDEATKKCFFSLKKIAESKIIISDPNIHYSKNYKSKIQKSGGQNTLQYGLEMVKHRRN